MTHREPTAVRRLCTAARRTVAGAALAVALGPLPAAAESLADAMVAAYRHAALLEQNRAVLRAADEDVAGAMARLRPVIDWTLSHSFRDLDGTETTSQTASLSAQMTLYDWGRRQLGIDAAKEIVLATRAQLIAVEQDVLLDAVNAYLTVRSARQQVELQQNSVRVLGEELSAANDRFSVGEITVTDVSLAEAQLAQTRAQLATAQGDLQIAIERYRAATGRDPGDLLAPPELPRLPESVSAAQAIAVRSHPAIEGAQRNVAAAEIQVAGAAAERRPEISGNASVFAQHSSIGGSDVEPGASLGIEMRQRIYAGGALSASHRQAMANRDRIRAQLLQTTRDVSEQVGVSWANIDVAGAQIRAIDEQISAAQQAYEGVREEATLGARTTLDVLDAEQDLLEARANRITAQANLQLAHYQLLSSMGLLTVENLQLGIPTYDPSAYYNAVRDAPSTSVQGQNLDRVLRALGR
ncbi:TolC family outer membrane protein [Paracoccus sp. S-4012]|uniref:TolC family outer membrane protein n=1 Tax=Paracoccus sp. S-4012 TaxID=2665648 RepID=UPI0012B09C7C|nr:TolC family outer membrane protein [Paracoccus sp. S-4012]MRX49632.1 TolC family outer membrane protein [Paracoccus sp. S-4012]